MIDAPDPFAHHPELRDKITNPADSFFRGITVEKLVEQFPHLEPALDWVHSDSDREATRAAALEGRDGTDLWIFAYGSLMWDPAIRFAEIRRAVVEGYARRFILMDDKGGRGTEEAPGLMAALDNGERCEGLAFRVSAGDVDVETEILWRREMIGPGYEPRFVMADIGDTRVEALTFVANHDAEGIRGNLTRAEQIRCIALGEGFLGTSREYLAGIVDQLGLLSVTDPDCVALLREVDDFLSSHTPSEPTVA